MSHLHTAGLAATVLHTACVHNCMRVGGDDCQQRRQSMDELQHTWAYGRCRWTCSDKHDSNILTFARILADPQRLRHTHRWREQRSRGFIGLIELIERDGLHGSNDDGDSKFILAHREANESERRKRELGTL